MSRALGVNQDTLRHVAKNANQMYRLARIIQKPDGSERRVYDAFPALKSIQKRIVSDILRSVEWPNYLQGGIQDLSSPRSPLSNAKVHLGARIIIQIDIKDFFPTIKSERILDIWQNFFGFSPECAELLANLCAYQGSLPQGGAPSTYLANLIFWRQEPILVRDLNKRGLTYSRYIDDICVSAKYKLTDSKKTYAISSVVSMLRKNGLAVNRRKLAIQSGGQRMSVNKITINSHPNLSRDVIRSIRASAHKAKLGVCIALDSKIYRRAKSRLARLRMFRPKLAERWSKLLAWPFIKS